MCLSKHAGFVGPIHLECGANYVKSMLLVARPYDIYCTHTGTTSMRNYQNMTIVLHDYMVRLIWILIELCHVILCHYALVGPC